MMKIAGICHTISQECGHVKWFGLQTYIYISSPSLLKALFLDCVCVLLEFLQVHAPSCTVNLYCTCVFVSTFPAPAPAPPPAPLC